MPSSDRLRIARKWAPLILGLDAGSGVILAVQTLRQPPLAD